MTDASVHFVIRQLLTADQQREIVGLLRCEAEPRLARQPHGYAAGRAFAWLAWQPSFADPPVAIEQPQGELWQRLREIVPEAEVAECWVNGRPGTSPGIRPHRDARYAQRRAWLVNLGVTTFRIWLPNACCTPKCLRAGKISSKFTEYEAHLIGGEVIEFDCKMLHGSRTSRERWAVGLWAFNDCWSRGARWITSGRSLP